MSLHSVALEMETWGDKRQGGGEEGRGEEKPKFWEENLLASRPFPAAVATGNIPMVGVPAKGVSYTAQPTWLSSRGEREMGVLTDTSKEALCTAECRGVLCQADVGTALLP